MKLKFISHKGISFSVFNNKKEYLGELVFDKKWKCMVWLQDEDVKMSKSCLQQVICRM
jgi:hypothetical protein